MNLVLRACFVVGLVAFVVSVTAPAADFKAKPTAKPKSTKPDEEFVAEPAAGGEKKADAKEVVRLRKLSGLGDRALVKTPYYRTSVTAGASSQPQDWAEIALTYDALPEWIDELVVRYYVLTMRVAEGGGKAYSLYKLSVRYVDIEKGRSHQSTAYLMPTALKRHGKVVAIGVEVVHEGQVVGEMSETDIPVPPGEKWWKNPTVVDSKIVVTREGYLLNRSDSPFRLVNIDDYPVIR